MKLLTTSILFLLLSSLLYAQKVTPFTTWSHNEIKSANTAKTFKEISFQERKVILYINLARINGELFAKTYLKDYMDEVRVPKNKFYRSLVKQLKEQPKMSPLKPHQDLIDECIKHSREMGKSGKKGHRSSDAKSFSERMEQLNNKYEKIKESNQYGFADAMSIVIDLLIDDEQESLRHRKMLLDPNFKYIGVGVRNHKKWRINTALLFAK